MVLKSLPIWPHIALAFHKRSDILLHQICGPFPQVCKILLKYNLVTPVTLNTEENQTSDDDSDDDDDVMMVMMMIMMML